VALLAHGYGYGEHQGRYARLIAALTGQGRAVYALDHRGHGRSTGPRATVERFDDFVDDLSRLDDRARTAHPGTPSSSSGTPLGGLIALRYALRYRDELHGPALSAPAVRPGGAPRPRPPPSERHIPSGRAAGSASDRLRAPGVGKVPAPAPA
jgi:alpha-beta hydrolase superfamily lysophospholipase